MTEECASRECVECKDKLTTYAPAAESSSQLIKYYQWQKDEVEKVETASSVAEVFAHLKHKLRSFLIHVYINHKQAAHMRMLKESADGTTILLQVDFSENASLQSQNEIQSCHWSHGQATLFTAYAWIANGASENFVLDSDELRHTKLSAFSFTDYLIKFLLDKYAAIKKINVFFRWCQLAVQAEVPVLQLALVGAEI